MLMQTAFHVSGAGTFYQQKDVDEEKLPDSKGFSQDLTGLKFVSYLKFSNVL